jgi:hypothetical protein
VASSCPMEFDRGLAAGKVPTPLEIMYLGRERAEIEGKKSMKELVSTIDMIVGTEWDEHAMRHLIASRPETFKKTSMYLSCEAQDEFGLETTTRAMHEAMVAHEIPHDFVVGSDPRNALSPHTLGSLSQIQTVFRTCTEHFSNKK